MGRHFNSTNPDYLIGSNTNADLDGGAGIQMTAAVWCRNPSASANQKLMGKWGDNQQWLMSLVFGGGLNFLQLAVRSDANGVRSITGSTPVFDADNTWHHLLVRKTAAVMEVWVDGTLDGQVADTGSIDRQETPFLIGIGGDASSHVDPLNGDLGYAAVWNTALSTLQIASLVGGADPGTVQAANLLGEWDLKTAQNPETDDSGHGANLTVVGTTIVSDPPVTDSGGGGGAVLHTLGLLGVGR